jgi:hypothetical protein
MKLLVKQIAKHLVLFITWLLVSPLYLYLSIKWKFPIKILRIIFFIVSPFTIILLLVAGFYVYDINTIYIQRGGMSEIEEKTGIDFPDYKTIKFKHLTSDRKLLHNDFEVSYTIELDSTDITTFYQNIEKQIPDSTSKEATGDVNNWRYWTKKGDFYEFSDMGTDNTETLSVSINTKNRVVEIKYGCY